jgi:acyl phosphate:glycerol-3-phosphate acyltransferase
MATFFLIAVVSYLLGSIPFGYLLVRIFRGEDVRQSGSGNIGATNVSRKSPVLGVLTLLLDALKGASAVWLTFEVLSRMYPGNIDVDLYPFAATAAVFAVIGHMFPVWLRFSGGKGVATSLGAFALLAPHAMMGSVAVFLVVVLVSRYVSLASIAASVSFPLLTWFPFRETRHDSLPWILPMAIVATLIIVKHHENIRRLFAGTENRLGSKNKQSNRESESGK